MFSYSHKRGVAVVAALLTLQAAPAAAQVGGDERFQALTRIDELQQEVRELTNLVETLEFELTRERRQREELQRVLSERIGDLERRLAVAAAGGGLSSGDGEADVGRVTVDDAEGLLQSGDAEAADGGVVAEAVDSGVGAAPQTAAPPDPAVVQRRYDEAFEFLKRSRYSRAVTAFRAFLDDYPDTDLSDDAAYWIAEAHYVTRAFADALQGFQRMRNRYPDSVRVPDATLKVGYIQYDIGAYPEARATFDTIVTEYPGSRVAISAKTRLQKMDKQGL